MQISESKLKQIIIESIEQEGLDDDIVEQIDEVVGGLKALGRAAKDKVAGAARGVAGTYKKGNYSAAKAKSIKSSLKSLEQLKASADQFEESDEFKAALDKAIGNLRSIDVAEPAPEPAPAPAAAQRTGDNRTTQRADAVAARQAQLDAEFKASKKASAPTAAAKPKISIMRGRGGAQAQLQKAGVAGKDMGNILKGLRSDLSAAGFETLEEVMEAKREAIKLDKTLSAIENMKDPQQKEKAKKVIANLLRQNKLKVSDPRLRPSQPQSAPTRQRSQRAPAQRTPATPAQPARTQRAPARAGTGAPIPANRGRRLPENKEETSKDLISEQRISRFAEIAGLKKGE